MKKVLSLLHFKLKKLRFLISVFYIRLGGFFIHGDFFHHINLRKFWEHKRPNTGTGEYIYSPFIAFWITNCVTLKSCSLICVISASKLYSHYTLLICWEQICSRNYQTSEPSSFVSDNSMAFAFKFHCTLCWFNSFFMYISNIPATGMWQMKLLIMPLSALWRYAFFLGGLEYFLKASLLVCLVFFWVRSYAYPV